MAQTSRCGPSGGRGREYGDERATESKAPGGCGCGSPPLHYDGWQPGSLSSIGPLKRVLAVNKPIQMAPGRGFEHRPADSDRPLAVDVRGVSLTFETFDGKVDALQGIDLEIAQGEFVSFIGPS